ncbi:hypothetical protein LCI18_003737 [Fusarium solani-melongenae]|uniref:Uncharacterized protein n=1 Tax=Fusarium solani subsp. cucurbitae TaxID=2747967 RepID=A0ACD3YV04_FUSSC|nr:hypothetical protein LCI18_003737 [Fusarium solani-melongenae]
MAFDFLETSMEPSTPGGQAASLLGSDRPAPDVSQSKAQSNLLESCHLPTDPDLPSPVQPTTTTGGDGAATSSYLTPVEEPSAFDSQAHLIEPLAGEDPAVDDFASLHDALPQQQVTQRLSTRFPGGGVLGPPLMAELPHSLEEVLALFFQEQVAPRIPVDLDLSFLFNASKSFRAAALALSASSMELLQRNSASSNILRLGNSHETPCFYYKSALHELEQGLERAQRDNVEEMASTYLLLAYHDMEVDSPLGVRYYASLIDELASGTNLEAFVSPGLFKAWRMLRCKRKFLSIATRATTALTDAWEPCSSYDHQLAIRDILVNVWKFHSRYAMEASFTACAEASASKQAAQWLQAALNRECDHQQAEQGSFKDIVTGPSFDPVVAYRLQDEDKAINYVMYLLARMTSGFLRSHFDQSCSAMVSETLGRMALGIFCGMNFQKRYFSMLRPHNLLLMIVLLGEGTALSSIVLEHLIPRALAQPLPPSEKALWILVRTAVTLIAKQRLRGKAIRLFISGSDGSHRPERLAPSHVLAAFGDYNGRGHFREIFPVQL